MNDRPTIFGCPARLVIEVDGRQVEVEHGLQEDYAGRVVINLGAASRTIQVTRSIPVL